MKRVVITLGCLLLASTSIAQDKEKVTSGHENILSSKVLKVSKKCSSDSADVLNQVTKVLNGSQTTVSIEYKYLATFEELVEVYDKKMTKGEDGKKIEKINIKEIERVVSRTKRFSDYVSLVNGDGSKKDEALLIAEAGSLALSLKSQCEESRKNLER